MPEYDPDDPELVPQCEEEASLAGLGLAPWVLARAAVIRQAHMEKRRNEGELTSRSKANSWRRGEYSPAGARVPTTTQKTRLPE